MLPKDSTTNYVIENKTSEERNIKHNVRRFNFVIFKNYDGTVTGHSIPRDVWLKLFGGA